MMGKYLFASLAFLLFASPAGAYGPSASDWLDATDVGPEAAKAACPTCPGSYVLNAVHGKSRPNLNNAAPNEIWAVGNAGLIVKFNGINWTPVTSPTTKNLYDVYINADGTGWAAGAGGTIIYLNGTGNWVCSNCPNGSCGAGGGGTVRTCSDLYDIFPGDPYGNSTTLFIVGSTECSPPESSYFMMPTVLYWTGTQWRKLTNDSAGCGASNFHTVPLGAGDCQPFGVEDSSSSHDCLLADMYTGVMSGYNQGMIFGYSRKPGFQRYWPYLYNQPSSSWRKHSTGLVDMPCASPKPAEWISALIGNYLVGAGDAEDCKSWAVAGVVNNLFYMNLVGSYSPIDTGLTPASLVLGTLRRIDFLPLWGFGIGVGWGPGMYTAPRADAYFSHFHNPDQYRLPSPQDPTSPNTVSYWQKPAAKTWKRLNGVFIDNYNDAWAVGDDIILHWSGPPVNPAVLDASFTTTRTGMQITLVMSVTNTGDAAVKDLDPRGLTTSLLPAGLPGANLVFAPSMIPALPPRGSAFFTWTYSLTGFGNEKIRFTGTAAGWDLIYSATTGTLFKSASADAYLPLSSAISTVTSRKCDGTYVIAITMTVTNTGIHDATNITPADPILSDPFAGKISGPDPAPVFAGPLVPTDKTYFYWTYTVSALPTTVTGYVAEAYLAVPDEKVFSKARAVASTTIASSLSSTMTVSAVQLGTNSYFFTVSMSVFNNSLNVINTLEATSTQTGAPWASMMSGPTPPSFANIASHWAEVFQWTYTSSGSLPVMFSGQAGGTDAVTGLPACTNATVTAGVATTPLTTSITTKTIQMGLNQYYLVVDMTVTNTGGLPMQDFTVTPNLSFTGGVSTSLWTGPITLAPAPSATGYYGIKNQNEGVTFEWTYSFTGNPSTVVSGTVNAMMSGSGSMVSKNFATLIATAQSPLKTSVSTRTHKLGKNEYFVVVEMTVTNTGNFPISDVLVGQNLAFSGLTSNRTGGPTALGGTCTGGTMYCGPALNLNQGTTFQWSYTVAGSLPSTITGTVSGKVPAWGIYVFTTFTGTTSLPKSTCLASSLSISPEEERTTLASRWKLTVVLTVSNTGICPGASVEAWPYKYLDVIPSGQSWYLSGPDPLSGGPILTGQQTSFTWTYSATGSATFTLAGSAMGEIDNPPTGAYGAPEDYPDYTEASATITTEDTGKPGSIRLDHNLFSSSNTKLAVTFNIKEDDPVATLIVYNSISQKIRVLHTGLAPRRVDLVKYWDGKNDNGDKVASGVYYIRLETNRYVITKKVILIK